MYVGVYNIWSLPCAARGAARLTVSAILSGLHCMLADMVAIVGSVENIGVIQCSGVFQLPHEVADHLVHSLE